MFNVSAFCWTSHLRQPAGDTTDQWHDQWRCENVTFIEPDMWSLNSLDLNPVDYAVWGALQQMVCQRRRFTTINQLKQAIVTEWGKLSQLSLTAQLVSGVAGLTASSSSKADTLNIWCKNCRCDSYLNLLWTITETINMLFPAVNFSKCVATEVILFSFVAFKTLDISQGSVATHLRCGRIFSNDLVTNFLRILMLKKIWKSVNIWQS